MAVRTLRRFTKTVFITLNSILALVFLLACLAPYLDPSVWWFMGFLGLAFPYLVILLIFSMFFWWVVNFKYSLIPILTLLIGFKQLQVLFGVKPGTMFKDRKDTSAIRIVDWNIRSFEGLSNKADKKRIDRLSIAEAIMRKNPDVVCLQEFNHSNVQDNFALFSSKYPHHYFSKDFKRRTNNYQSGSVIFSKHPIIDSGRIEYPGPYNESLIFADIKGPHGTIRVLTTHLQSFKFNKRDYEGMEQIKNTENQSLQASKSLFQKMRLAFTKRSEQARIVRSVLEKVPYPAVLCGDFNDVPNSYTYAQIRSNWQDAFLATSMGIGRTFIDVAPTLRIDYIMVEPRFDILQFDMVDEALSDHLMLITDVALK
ncbi:hypothetical protein EXU57_13740 [Segetibacter sp. 3557_3]|uniref:endonuclease/exonuclease/phosphatase family protein n=1 Tax=Segetibacter sp. 3557_3 TaxID=2547429 RepID=UPI00105885C5|nr:endonuclease/exonuclease/phosphatase family protein [Segetibacter sp. 3557_3]TDH25165.1 hypothetical protein EXU57_13740 [Segetibacter sp. 3557_3]